MLELNKSQKQIQKAVRDFTKGEFDKEQIIEIEKSREYPKEILQKASELGFTGIHFPENMGGSGMGLFDNVIVTEELCRKSSSLGITLSMAGYASEILLRSGSDELKKKFLPKIAQGEMLSGGAFTEPDQGSDISKIKTTAVKEGDSYTINGNKTFVVNGGMAGFYVVLCKTDSSATPETNGMTLILVEADREGVTTEDVGRRLGVNMMATADLLMRNVKIPVSNRIGDEGKGYALLQKFFIESRILVAAQALGTAEGALDRSLVYIKGREQFSRPIAKFQVTQHKIADMATKVELARLITYEAASQFDQGKIDAKTASMAKLAAAQAAMAVTDEALQLHGGYGYMTEYEVENFYRDAKVCQIREGNERMQKDIIAEAVIGRIK
jgi:alkylation response protein AidB-like acyl-CoA dehydrogenase